MTGKCGADCTNRCSIGACPKAEPKDEFDGFILDFILLAMKVDDGFVQRGHIHGHSYQVESACKLTDDGDCVGCKL